MTISAITSAIVIIEYSTMVKPDCLRTHCLINQEPLDGCEVAVNTRVFPAFLQDRCGVWTTTTAHCPALSLRDDPDPSDRIDIPYLR